MLTDVIEILYPIIHRPKGSTEDPVNVGVDDIDEEGKLIGSTNYQNAFVENTYCIMSLTGSGICGYPEKHTLPTLLKLSPIKLFALMHMCTSMLLILVQPW